VLIVAVGRDDEAGGADDGDAVTVVVTTEPLGPVLVHAASSIPATATAASEPTIRSLTCRSVYSVT
jgi:hypothetical protein